MYAISFALCIRKELVGVKFEHGLHSFMQIDKTR